MSLRDRLLSSTACPRELRWRAHVQRAWWQWRFIETQRRAHPRPVRSTGATAGGNTVA